MLGYPNDFVSFSESLSLAQEDKNNIFISLVSERKNDAIPFAVKDNICTLTTPTTCASRNSLISKGFGIEARVGAGLPLLFATAVPLVFASVALRLLPWVSMSS